MVPQVRQWVGKGNVITGYGTLCIEKLWEVEDGAEKEEGKTVRRPYLIASIYAMPVMSTFSV